MIVLLDISKVAEHCTEFDVYIKHSFYFLFCIVSGIVNNICRVQSKHSGIFNFIQNFTQIKTKHWGIPFPFSIILVH